MDRTGGMAPGLASGAGVTPVRAAGSATGRATLLPVVATAVALLAVGIVAISLLVWVVRGFGPLPVSFGRTVIGVVGLVVSTLSYAAVGAVLAIRVRGNVICWLFLLIGLALAAMLPVNLLVASVHDRLRPAPDAVVTIAWLRTSFATPVVVTLMIVAVLLFPTGRPIGRRWWAAIGLAMVGGSLLALAAAVNPEGLISYPTIPNPFAAPPELVALLDLVRLAAVVLLLVGIVLAAASIGLRYRAGGPIVRAQLRWILLAVAITAVAGAPFLVTRYLLDVGEVAGEVGAMLAQVGSCSIPIAAAFAATRYRLYQVDLLIGRTLVYVPLTAILAGMYAAMVLFFQRVFVALTGEPSDLAILFTLVLVTAVLTPIRKWLERIVEQRFATAARGWAEEVREAELAQERAAAHDGAPAGQEGALASGAVASGAAASDAVASGAVASGAAGFAIAAGSIPIVSRMAPVDPARYRVVDHAGRVACPVTGNPTELTDCLACADFEALARTPAAAVVCRGRYAQELAAHDAS